MGAVTPQLATRLTTGKWFLQVALMPEIRTMAASSKIVERSKEIADEERDSASGFGSDNRT